MASYQIKSTPFFQRIVATSKKNGELQKLKEEYERIKEFNEKTLDVRVRHARLKRLYQEIEDIREADNKKRRVSPQDVKLAQENVSPKKQRMRSLHNAKQLGQAYSRHNAVGGIASGTATQTPLYRSKINILSRRERFEQECAKAHEIRDRMVQRDNYGNRISNWNMEKMLMGQLRNEVARGIKETASVSYALARKNALSNMSLSDRDRDRMREKEKLEYRLYYGNKLSSMNMQRRRSSLGSQLQRQDSDGSDTIVAGSDCAYITAHGQYYDDDDYATANAADSGYVVAEYEGQVQPLYGSSIHHEVALRRIRTNRHRWHKAAALISFLVSKPFQLPYVPNDTNLLHSQNIPRMTKPIDMSEADDEYVRSERLMTTQRLTELDGHGHEHGTSPQMIWNTPPAVGVDHMSLMLQQRLNLKPVNTFRSPYSSDVETVNLQLYKPEATKPVEKEVYDSSVQKLMQVFEHYKELQ